MKLTKYLMMASLLSASSVYGQELNSNNSIIIAAAAAAAAIQDPLDERFLNAFFYT